MGYDVRLTDVKLLTASACHNLCAPLHLEQISKEQCVTYTPEIFPALVLKKQGVTFSCFHTGKIVITGIKTTKDIQDTILPTLVELYLYTS